MQQPEQTITELEINWTPTSDHQTLMTSAKGRASLQRRLEKWFDDIGLCTVGGVSRCRLTRPGLAFVSAYQLRAHWPLYQSLNDNEFYFEGCRIWSSVANSGRLEPVLARFRKLPNHLPSDLAMSPRMPTSTLTTTRTSQSTTSIIHTSPGQRLEQSVIIIGDTPPAPFVDQPPIAQEHTSSDLVTTEAMKQLKAFAAPSRPPRQDITPTASVPSRRRILVADALLTRSPSPRPPPPSQQQQQLKVYMGRGRGRTPRK